MAEATEREARRNEAEAAGEETTPQAQQNEDHRARRPTPGPRMNVRAADLEPYIGLKYLSRLFKLIAIVLILLLVSEAITLLVSQGTAALQDVLMEVSRLVVFAGLLWGVGDLAILLIDMGHDLRATRILIGRQLAHTMDKQHAQIDPGMSHSIGDSESPV
jgi:hypothetical protein